MTNKQDKWIEEVMGSLRNMQPAEGNPHLHTRIIARLGKPLPNRNPVQLRWVYSFSAIFILMLMLNVWGWRGSESSSADASAIQQPVNIETLISDYGLENSYTSLP